MIRGILVKALMLLSADTQLHDYTKRGYLQDQAQGDWQLAVNYRPTITKIKSNVFLLTNSGFMINSPNFKLRTMPMITRIPIIDSLVNHDHIQLHKVELPTRVKCIIASSDQNNHKAI